MAELLGVWLQELRWKGVESLGQWLIFVVLKEFLSQGVVLWPLLLTKLILVYIVK